MISRRSLLAAGAMAMAASFSVSPAMAQAQFERTVRIIVPFAPGGTSDILARLIAPELQKAIGQSVIVENKPGAAGNLGADLVAKAPKDGHTLLLLDVGSLATAPSLFTNLTYNPQNDLAPVGMVMFAPYVLAVNPSLPVKSIKELIDYGKANPGKLAVANSGIGGLNHITGVTVAKKLGIEWKNVPYKGGSAATRAVVAGESNVIINGATATLPFVTNKQLVGLAITGEERLKQVSDLPTFKESDLPLPDAGTWQGVLTTAGSPPALIERLNAELKKILAQPEIVARIGEQGGAVKIDTPDSFKSWLASATTTWGGIVKEAGITVQE